MTGILVMNSVLLPPTRANCDVPEMNSVILMCNENRTNYYANLLLIRKETIQYNICIYIDNVCSC